MSVRVQLPPLLRPLVGGARFLEADGSSVAAVLTNLAAKHPALALHFFDERGAVRHNIVCIHDGALVRAREAAAYQLKPGDELVLANALAGG